MLIFQKKATVGFEPTPRRTSALNWRLRPLGHVTMLLRYIFFRNPVNIAWTIRATSNNFVCIF